MTLTTQDFDNAELDLQTISEVTNNSGYLDPTTTNRTGAILDTLIGALSKLGYQPPVAYTGGISFSGAGDVTKTIDNSGTIYAPLPSEIPFTTSGTWGTDESKFFVVQGVLGGGSIPFKVTKYDTAGAHVWTKDVATTSAIVIARGSGGGGATGHNSIFGGLFGGGGAGQGAFSVAFLAGASLSATETVSIGAAGSGGVGGSADNNGTAGADCYFGSPILCLAKGGAGGGGVAGYVGGAGGDAATSIGDVIFSGESGNSGNRSYVIGTGGFTNNQGSGTATDIAGGYGGGVSAPGAATTVGGGGYGGVVNDAINSIATPESYAGGQDGDEGFVIVLEY